jgi:hypothetical protein
MKRLYKRITKLENLIEQQQAFWTNHAGQLHAEIDRLKKPRHKITAPKWIRKRLVGMGYGLERE